jgi:hypothetical protein
LNQLGAPYRALPSYLISTLWALHSARFLVSADVLRESLEDFPNRAGISALFEGLSNSLVQKLGHVVVNFIVGHHHVSPLGVGVMRILYLTCPRFALNSSLDNLNVLSQRDHPSVLQLRDESLSTAACLPDLRLVETAGDVPLEGPGLAGPDPAADVLTAGDLDEEHCFLLVRIS